MSGNRKLPLVGIPCDMREIGIHPFHAAGEKYINAVAHGAHVMPVLLPCFGKGRDLEPLDSLYAVEDLLDRIDGVFLPGSPSNVHPDLYGGQAPRPATLLDPQRDSLVLPLIRCCLDRGMPLFAVCRGIQELNVALGGTLHQHVEEVAGRMDHREDKSQPRDRQYAPAHDVEVHPGGVLQEIVGCGSRRVNSVHGQGIDRLAPGLRLEATAPDGQIEAVSVTDAPTLQLGVQWHPEWRYRERQNDRALFSAFGEACRSWRRNGRATARAA